MYRKLCIVLWVLLLLGACTLPRPEQLDIEPEANFWHPLGTSLDLNFNQNAFGSSLTLDSSGNPVVGWTEEDSTSRNVYIKRWNGSSWTQLGGALDIDFNQNAGFPHLALDITGNPVVSWQEYTSGFTNPNIYVKRWDGSSWVQLGDSLDVNVNHESFASNLDLDDVGNPVVSWIEDDGTSFNIYVKRWNGTTWVQLGGSLTVLNPSSSADNIGNPALIVDSSGNPVVSWHECIFDTVSLTCDPSNVYVKRWDGTDWIQLERISFWGSNPDLALDSVDNPVVSWIENGTIDEGFTNLYVKRWDGSNWVQIGTALDVNIDEFPDNPNLVLDSADNPIVSWVESNSGNNDDLYVKRWNGSSWVQIGTALDINVSQIARSPNLAVDNSGNPVVGWFEYENNFVNPSVYVKRYISNDFQGLGGSLDVQNSQSASDSSITRRSNNNPVVAWEELDSTNSSKNIYVKEWNGSTWIAKGIALDKVLGNNAENPSIALRTNNTIHVAWQENGNVYQSYWNGSAWTSQGTANGGALDTSLVNTATSPSLAIRSDNLPVVAYVENANIKVKRLIGTTWTLVGTSLDVNPANKAFAPSLALEATTNNPVVAWYEQNGTSFNIYVKRFDGTSWVDMDGVGIPNALDITLSQNATNPVLALQTNNRPFVAWEEAGNIYVKRWNGSSWVSAGVVDKVITNEAIRPVIDVSTDNLPVVSWQEKNGASYDVWVKRRVGTTWLIIGTPLDKTLSSQAQRPSLVLKSDNTPIVSWDEHDGPSENVWVKMF